MLVERGSPVRAAQEAEAHRLRRQGWGDRWVFGEGREPVVVRDRRTGRRPIPRLRILDEDGAPIAARDLEIVPGPGAEKRTVARYRRIAR